MTDRDFEKFSYALNELACGYLAKIEGDELAAYFRILRRFPIEIVEQVLLDAPSHFPTFFPKAGELLGLCEAAVTNLQQRITSIDSVAAMRLMDTCDHDFKWEAEPEGVPGAGLFAGFDVCTKCKLSRPRLRASADKRQVEVFEQAIQGGLQWQEEK